MKIDDILKVKGLEVATIPVDAVVADAMSEMVGRNIGSLVVTGPAGEIEGILTERDILIHAHRSTTNCKGLAVREVMTPKEKLVVGRSQDDVEAAMAAFTERHIRHLPIVSAGGTLAGMISIGDVINALLSDREFQIRTLQDYIQNVYPG